MSAAISIVTEGDQLAEAIAGHIVAKTGLAQKTELSFQARLEEDRCLDKEEAAHHVRQSVRKVEIWMRKLGDRGGLGLPYVKLGPGDKAPVVFRRASLEAWLRQWEQNTVNPQAAA